MHGGEDTVVTALKAVLADAKGKATDDDHWEQMDQSLLVSFCRHAERKVPTLKQHHPFPGRSAGRPVLRAWLRLHFSEEML